jgi:hypothetical protein
MHDTVEGGFSLSSHLLNIRLKIFMDASEFFKDCCGFFLDVVCEELSHFLLRAFDVLIVSSTIGLEYGDEGMLFS